MQEITKITQVISITRARLAFFGLIRFKAIAIESLRTCQGINGFRTRSPLKIVKYCECEIRKALSRILIVGRLPEIMEVIQVDMQDEPQIIIWTSRTSRDS